MSETESQFGSWFEDLLTRLNYRWIHFTPATAFSGKVITSQRGHKGWPDYSCVKDGRFFVAELKTDKTYPSPEQRTWHAALEAAGVTVFVWRPRDRDAILKELTK